MVVRGISLGRVRRGLLMVALATVFWAPSSAFGDTEGLIADSKTTNPEPDSGWQAGTCTTDSPTCGVATDTQFFEQAAGHPPVGFTQFIVRSKAPGQTPVAELATVRVDLPVGLSVNPSATDQCPLLTFKAGAGGCPDPSKVGKSFVTVSLPPLGTPAPPQAGLTEVDVYNVEPEPGEAARFGLELAGNEVYLEGDVAWSSDYHEGFTIHVPEVLPEALGSLLGLLGGEKGLILKNRLVFNGQAGDGTFITAPSTCLGPAYQDPWTPGEAPTGPSGHIYSTYLRVSSTTEEADPSYDFPQDAGPALESPIPPGTSPKGCATIPYEPEIAVDPGTEQANSPAGAAVNLTVPHIEDPEAQDSSNTRTAKVTLPRGMGINPSAANGLKVCTDGEFGKGTQNPVACPPESRIGSVTIDSPPLRDEDLEGDVYVGQQLSRDPTSGEEYRIFINAVSERYGVDARLVGNVSADPITGQLTTTISEAPQVPFTSFLLEFDGGQRAVLSSPPTCGPNATTTSLTPWAAAGNNRPPATPGDEFQLTAAPGGGACAKTMVERAFTPAFAVAPKTNKAGAYSPLSMRLARTDGQQELKGVDITLPPGMTGKLAGIPYCPESAIAAAIANAGKAERAASSCPAASLVGSATVNAGTGPAPLQITGKAFLSGPYKGAPLSLAVVTPATAGPFDLGTVVVRVALFLEPETAQIHAVSDPIPDVYGGTQLSVRSVDVDLDRENFTLNPTSCDALAGGGALRGGGANPADPLAFSAFPVAIGFQSSDCGALKFRPKLYTRLFGGKQKTKRGQFPKFRATLVAREGDANIRRAAVTLSAALILEQGHIRTLCTRPQLAAGACPQQSIYGNARAKSPLLDDELVGPVYLVPGSTDSGLPDLLADLRGQVNIRLRGVISATKGRLKTVFPTVPDVPVSKFVLTMKGGKRGLLTATRDLCNRRVTSVLNFEAQNGKKLKKKKLKLRVPGCRAGAGKAKGSD